MARRRRIDEPEVDTIPTPPPELLTVFVEDWLPDDYQPPPWEHDEHLDPLIVARRHHRDARKAWGKAHGLRPAELGALVPLRRPTWRNPRRPPTRPTPNPAA